MTDRPMMTCGHTANAEITAVGGVALDVPLPTCAICSCATPAPAAPDLTGRTMRCSYYGTTARGRTCTSERSSHAQAAFFEHRPDEPHDRFYCGCWGWD